MSVEGLVFWRDQYGLITQAGRDIERHNLKVII